MQESLESSLVEKENTLAKTSEKLELVSSLRESLSLKETQFKEVSDKLLQTEHSVSVLVFVFFVSSMSTFTNTSFLFFFCPA